MKYIIYETQLRGEMRIALDAKVDGYAPDRDELEIGEGEVARHHQLDRFPVKKPGRITTFGQKDQSYPQLLKLFYEAGIRDW